VEKKELSRPSRDVTEKQFSLVASGRSVKQYFVGNNHFQLRAGTPSFVEGRWAMDRRGDVGVYLGGTRYCVGMDRQANL
jgi:hypothetical protein